MFVFLAFCQLEGDLLTLGIVVEPAAQISFRWARWCGGEFVAIFQFAKFVMEFEIGGLLDVHVALLHLNLVRMLDLSFHHFSNILYGMQLKNYKRFILNGR